MTDSDDSDGILPSTRRTYLFIQAAALSGAATGVASADSHGYGEGAYGEGAYGGTQDDEPSRKTSSTRSDKRNDNAKRRTSSTRSSD